jgi:glycine oxidase
VTAVVVVGGGLTGRCTAWRLVQSGRFTSVRVLERRDVDRGASHACAGVAGAQLGALLADDESQLDLALRARERLRQLCQELGQIGAGTVQWGSSGLLAVASNDSVARRWADAALRQRHRGLRAEIATPITISELEPALAPSLAGGVFLPEDASVDSRQLLDSLEAALAKRHCTLERGVEVHEVKVSGSRVSHLETSLGPVEADAFVFAAGPWTADLLPHPNLRPVMERGTLLELAKGAPHPSRPVFSHQAFLVPRGNHVLLGAVWDRVAYDESVTLHCVTTLGQAAHTLMPGVTARALVAARSGLVASSHDGAPRAGRLPGVDNAAVATDHGRWGMLYSALTAELLLGTLTDREPPVWAQAWAPER